MLFLIQEFKPKRSVIFINYTAEEKGFHGSQYFANSDIFKSKKVVANVNIDILTGLNETSDISPIGYTHSNLSEAVDYATEKLNLTINDPKKFEDMLMEGSDHFPLIKKGVAPVYVCTGIKAIDPKINANKKTKKWIKKIFHSPFDDLNQQYSHNAFYTALKVNFLITYYIANEMDSIIWNKNSWVYKKYIETKNRN